MKKIFFIQILLTIITKIKSLDNSTLSNYIQVPLQNLSGIFEPDFATKTVNGNLTYTFLPNTDGSTIILDTKNLQILSIKTESKSLEFSFGKTDKNLGTPLIIKHNFTKNTEFQINIIYQTLKNGSSAQFLTKEQTMGKKFPYFFTMSESILGRELLPSQDTPAVKFPFYLGIKVPQDLKGMISGIFAKSEKTDQHTIYYYHQTIPVPNYLIALVAGDIAEKQITENISVFTEPVFLEKAYNELTDLPKIINYSIQYMGPYEWGKYNVLILPNSFPFSGMENPCLSFCSPCLINGDKSLVDIIFHELIHSWSGNLVTNENWRDFWLNEGVTMFLQRKVISKLNGKDYANMDAILGLSYIEFYLDYFGENSTYTSLRPDLSDVSPDDVYSDIPYEKGFNFLFYIESLIGEATMEKFFKNYFRNFKFKSVDFFDFQSFFIEFCRNISIPEDILAQIDWNAWIFKPGKCPISNNFSNVYEKEMNENLEKFLTDDFDAETLKNTFNNWTHTTKVVFMNKLQEKNGFLTEKQHEFFTKTLKLYANQNFLVTTNYFHLILEKTDEFFEFELENLIQFLSSFGAVDYMTGMYKFFYQRDEVKSIETLNNLRNFYHSIMIKKAEEEIDEAKNNFPILTIDLKENQCFSTKNLNNIKIDVVSSEFKEILGNLTISKGIFLFNEIFIELECFLNFSEKFCKIKEKKNGIFYLKIPKRIQHENFAIKIHNGSNKIKFSDEIFINENLTKNYYEIDYAKNKEKKIEIFFDEKTQNAHLMNENKEIQCEFLINKMICIVNNEILEIDQKNPKNFKNYLLKIVDDCHIEKFVLNVNVKNSGDNNKKFVFVFVLVFIFVFVLFFLICFVCKICKKKNNFDDLKNKLILYKILK